MKRIIEGIQMLFEEVSFWLSSIPIEIRRIIKGIKNIIRWAPIIYKDRDWDYTYFYDILEFKLKSIADSIEKNQHHEGYEIHVANIREAIRLIEVLRSEKYYDEVWEYYPNEFEENLDAHFAKYPKEYKEVLKGWKPKEGEVFGKLTISYRISQMLHERDKAKLFDILRKDIECWWD